jgi:hypothetical protein
MIESWQAPQGNQVLGFDLLFLDFDDDIGPARDVFGPFAMTGIKGDGLINGTGHQVLKFIHACSPLCLTLMLSFFAVSN